MIEDRASQSHSVIVSTVPGSELDLAGTDDTTVLALGHDDRIYLADPFLFEPEGSNNTIIAAGDRTLVTLGEVGPGLGNHIDLLGRNDTVTGAADPGSNDTIESSSKGAVILVGGYNSVLLNGTDATVTIVPVLRADSQDPFGTNDVVATGTGKATVTGGGESFSFTGGAGGYVVSGGGAEHATISGGSGGGIFTGGFFKSLYPFGPDGDQRYSYAGNNIITAGERASTLVGAAHGSSVLIATGAVRDVLIAGQYGNDTMSGGTATANNIYQGYSGIYTPTDDVAVPSLVVQAGSGNDTLIAGSAAETLTGGAGHDQFRFIEPLPGAVPPGGNSTVITDFLPGIDKIDLSGFSVTSKQVVAAETLSGGSTYLSLPGHLSITLLHVTDLSPKNFTHS